MDWKQLSTKKIKKVYKSVFLNHCYLCHEKSTTTICHYCQENLPANTQCCSLCKHPTPEGNTLCGQCQSHPPTYKNCIAPYRFEGIIKTLIHNIKFNQGHYYIHPLIHLLKEKLMQEYSSKPWPKQILYIPSHPNRIKERGFCQTQIMAKQLIKNLQQDEKVRDLTLPLSNPLKKCKHTHPQHSLSRKERLKNPKNSYKIDTPVAKHIALFDDVMTTGSTIEHCTKLLLSAGAEQVDIWVIARTPDKQY